LAARTFRETYATTAAHANIEAHVRSAFSSSRQAAEIGDPTVRTLLAEVDGQLAGYAQIVRGAAPDAVSAHTRGREALEIRRFYIASEWHGRGVAQQLMAACIRRRQPGESVWLGVFSSNPRAIAFYKKCGFRIVGEQTFTMGQDAQRDHVMLWEGAA
jgi:ribosomal protein S18 acetylase RimI-like enzyme